jgi:3-dehydroquinate synthase
MEIVNVKGSAGTSEILVGEKLRNLSHYVPVDKCIIITDTNVNDLYREKFPPCPVIVIGTGESIKTMATVQQIYDKLIQSEAQRSSFIVGVGGGIVCDITGFVASTYLRGVNFGFVSSTLLSQVDASVGGKNGVNFAGYKNMVGVFNQPRLVICDLDLLGTLPHRERSNGFAEIVKHAAIGDSDMFNYLETECENALALDSRVIQKLVADSVKIKADVVNRDEKESGERRKLNFGHTFGHAIEKNISAAHGEAVSAGMVVAAALSVKQGLLSGGDADRLKNLLKQLKLPTHFDIEPERILDAMRKDKKREGDAIQFVLLEKIGKAIIRNIPLKHLEKVINELKE